MKPSSSKKYKSKKPMKSKFKKMKSKIPKVYRFKRLTREVRLAHYAGAAANQFVEEDSANILTAATGTVWAAESMPSTYQNQYACTHSLNQLEAPGDFTQLFQQYKITGVKATFLYQVTDAPTNGGSVMPTILYAVDGDDAFPPTYSQLRQKQNVKQKILTANKPFSIYYKPKISGTLTAGGVNTSNSLVTKGWINSAVANADHYGLKFGINNMYSTTSVNTQLEIKFTYYLAMKDVQ